MPGQLSIENTILSDKLEVDPVLASNALNMSLELLIKLSDLWSELPSAKEIFTQFLPSFLKRLDKGNMHSVLVKSVATLQANIDAIVNNSSNRDHAVPERKKQPIKMLKLYDPELADK